MPKTDKDNYDIVIIGAGIGGLVCGCCLAKAGMRVLIAERHHKPGGYCTSFTRQGFTFDAAAHSFGGYKFGNLGEIFREIGIDEIINVKKFDPSDIIVTPDNKISFWADVEKTVEGLQTVFPEESDAIRIFFNTLISPVTLSFSRMRSWTFKTLLDQYFKSDNLKAILSFPLFGNGGLPPSRMSAFIGCKIFKEFLLDGGYHPENGMQALPDALVKKLKDFGGELRLSSCVNKIWVQNNEVRGVTLEHGDYISAQTVVSNCDARETFFELIGKDLISHDFADRIESMIPSTSMFILYLGIDKVLCNALKSSVNIWLMYHYDLDKIYNSARAENTEHMGGYLIHLSPERECIMAFINTSFRSDNYWNNHKEQLTEFFLNRIERDIIPNLSQHVVYKESATPKTLYRYTRNYQGAAFGWEHSPSQLADHDFKAPPFIGGLYLTGHWTTSGLGIPGVTYLGWDTANIIIKRKKRSKNAIL